MRVISLIGCIFLVFFLSGCGTISTIGEKKKDHSCLGENPIPRIYSGIFYDVSLVKYALYDGPGPDFEFGMGITDFPFSLALDTVVLPYTVYTQIKYGDICGYYKEPYSGY